MVTVTSRSTAITWRPDERLAMVRYAPGASLRALDADFLVESLRSWIGPKPAPFAVLADAAGLRGTDADYRSKASSFFRAYREVACIALVNLAPVIHIVVELFRVGTGVQLKTFRAETEARAWLRAKGFVA
jgi:hypothetical protein